MKKYSRHVQRGAINILLVGLAGIGVMALTAANLNAIRTSQDQQFSLHTNTQATANAWDGVELFRLYLQGLSSTDLAALAPNASVAQPFAVAITGVNNLAASVVSNVPSGTAGRRITANITGTGAGSSATVQVVYDVAPASTPTPLAPGSAVTTLGDVNINSNLVLTGSIDITGNSAAKLWVTGTVDLKGSVSGIDQICATDNVTVSSAISVNKVCTNGTLTLNGGASVVTAEVKGAVTLNGGSTSITTLTSNGDVTLFKGSARVGTLNTKGNVSLENGGDSQVTGVLSAEGDVTWGSAATANIINANGNVIYKGANNKTVINSVGNVTVEKPGGSVKDITAMGDVFLQTGYGLGVEGRLLGGGKLSYTANNTAVAGKVKGVISGPVLWPWSPVMNVTQDTSLAVSVSPVSVATLNFTLKPPATVDVYALKALANYVFEVDSTNRRMVTVRNVAGITDGQYYLGNYPYVWNVPGLDRGNFDYLCTTVNASGVCTAPTLPYKTLCQGYSVNNTCFNYTPATKKWDITGESMAPGFAWFEGSLNVGVGTYFNTFAASGSITTSGDTKVYAPNYLGSGAVCSNTNTPGITRDYRLTGLVPTDVCNTTTYTPNAVGNIALMAGGFVNGVFKGGDITLGHSNVINGGVIAGNVMKTTGSTTINGSVQVAGQGVGNTSPTAWGASTTMDLKKTSTYNPGIQPCMINCSSGTGTGTGTGTGGGASVFWTRYL